MEHRKQSLNSLLTRLPCPLRLRLMCITCCSNPELHRIIMAITITMIMTIITIMIIENNSNNTNTNTNTNNNNDTTTTTNNNNDNNLFIYIHGFYLLQEDSQIRQLRFGQKLLSPPSLCFVFRRREYRGEASQIPQSVPYGCLIQPTGDTVAVFLHLPPQG